MQDQVYRKSQSHIVDFAFTAEVADVFPDMIRRSVPGYETVIPMTGLIAARHLGADGRAFDLGCSLGATTQAILSQNDSPHIRVTGMDNSAPMIERATELNQDSRATFVLADAQDTATHAQLEGANVILLNFVLQFFEPVTRLDTLRSLRTHMADDGLLLVSEKVKHSEASTHALFDQTHLAWKQANGYSELEISQKRSALENVMRVDTIEAHQQRFIEAGFSRVIQWYQCMNWASFLVYP
ncbi:MAG: carboxy-S-adenosyl-L-methionine synthase CmoA [Pseudomonadales bacterium]